MIGISEEPGRDEQDLVGSQSHVADSDAGLQTDEAVSAALVDSVPPERILKESVKKRRLYRNASDESVVWFPQDNQPDLLKVFVWDSGSPRWVLNGTPASVAGVSGCLESGVSVVTLCEDGLHDLNLGIAVKERAVEAMLAGSRVFGAMH